MKDSSNNDNTSTPLAANIDNNDGVSSVLNKHQPVGQDLRIDPDPDLQGYQEELDAGGGNDVIENEDNGTTPSEITTMPASELKPELDRLAIDEQEATPDDGLDEDRRESIEDLDEADHRE